MSDRIPPHNLIAERSLLGELFRSQHAREVSLELVSSTDFYRDAHGMIFDAIRRLYDNGEPVSVATVGDALLREKSLEFVGGMPELIHIYNDTSGSSDGQRHARIIVDHARMRDVIRICASAALAAYALPDDVMALIEHLQAEVDALELPLGKLPEGLWTVEDFMNRPRDKESEWVIRGLLRDDWRVVIVAVEGFGKTMLLQQLALCAARGVHPFVPNVDCPVMTTLLVDCENPKSRLDDGFDYIMPRLDLTKPAIPNKAYLWSQPGGIDLLTRHDRSELEAVIAHVQPQVVCAGPVYKTFESPAGDNYEQVAKKVMRVWDSLRTRYKFALVLEAHASKGSGGVRSMDPEGSALWLRWSEFGLKFLRDETLNHGDENIYYKVGKFRLDRIRNHGWPSGVERAEYGMPWGARWADSKWQEYIRDDFAEVQPPEPELQELDDDPFL